jgi:hypothetical protein
MTEFLPRRPPFTFVMVLPWCSVFSIFFIVICWELNWKKTSYTVFFLRVHPTGWFVKSLSQSYASHTVICQGCTSKYHLLPCNGSIAYLKVPSLSVRTLSLVKSLPPCINAFVAFGPQFISNHHLFCYVCPRTSFHLLPCDGSRAYLKELHPTQWIIKSVSESTVSHTVMCQERTSKYCIPHCDGSTAQSREGKRRDSENFSGLSAGAYITTWLVRVT